ncbi:MAG: SufE family protein [Candidatus Thermoplasmatota archaeon]|jgi:cysteine desulfuration protein SufE|nr:SufE family protein [Candidatus Thermoplasmatota archaeon]MEC7508463.1 SufE family protein [Candidatus Thermoplasmatota archaeon]MEC7600806.1 SufE family protein [Candidatus Thermoplasmatota archaeon]MEC8152080.1 SufE family protein [Candidatus Thermoplasmatota archaeon]MEC8398801.1 SufE family protein [Candidatus Thermoplasmatota archaeon]|tara:strand:- start:193 stop:609 length:417 start_codon:yes stop_codon:yes gene_type:complete
MTFYPEALQELIEEFKEVADKRERLEMVFELADEVVLLPTDEWTEDTRIRGCQSEAHVRIALNDGLVHMVGAADAKLVQGLMGVLSIAIEGLAPAQAALIPVDFAEEMGLLNSLTPSRSNGFRNMYDKVMDEIRASME